MAGRHRTTLPEELEAAAQAVIKASLAFPSPDVLADRLAADVVALRALEAPAKSALRALLAEMDSAPPTKLEKLARTAQVAVDAFWGAVARVQDDEARLAQR